jgi:hypothetical protein
MIVIGIDTGTNTGLAIWDTEAKKLTEVNCYLIHKALDKVKLCVEAAKEIGVDLYIRVEDARQVKFGTNKFKAQGAGSVKRDASIWEDFLTDLGVKFEMVRPQKAITKMDSANFKKITGWNSPTNSHSRDAALLVFKFNSIFK